MVVIKKEWKVFIRQINLTGDKIEAYLAAYPKCRSRKSAATNAEKLLKKDEINSLIKATPTIQKEARLKAVEELKDEIKFDALTVSQKREFLKSLAMGELIIEEHFIKRDGTVGKYNRKPNVLERLKAIEIDNRMAGDDAPQKHEVAVNANFTAIYKKALSLKMHFEKTSKK